MSRNPEAKPSPQRSFLLEVLTLTLTGIIIGGTGGVIWALVAPRSRITAIEDGYVALSHLSGASIGDDMTFMLIAVVCSVVLVAIAFRIAFKNSVASWFGVLLGSFLGTLMIFLVGVWLGDLNNVDPTQLAPGESTDTSLEIQATGVLFVWPMWALLFVAVVLWVRSRRVSQELKQLPGPTGVTESSVAAASKDGREPVNPTDS